MVNYHIQLSLKSQHNHLMTSHATVVGTASSFLVGKVYLGNAVACCHNKNMISVSTVYNF